MTLPQNWKRSDHKRKVDSSPALKLRLHSAGHQRNFETKISELEEMIAAIKTKMDTCGSDFTKLQELMEEEKKWREQLDYLMERWEYLAEFAE